ncbi:MAG: polysulfide reductase NrfD, partial [Gemmatimonadales bacterium]
GWHTTIFPPYFVAGAVFGGFAMVLTIMIPARYIYGLQDLITMKHIENMAKIILLTGTIVGYAYLMELFVAFYSGAKYEGAAFFYRIAGPYWWAYLAMMSCNVLSPQLFWFKKIRRSIPALFVISIFVNIGMFYERFVIIVSSLAHEYVPSGWGLYTPSWVEIAILIGAFCWFYMWFLIFAKMLPTISIAEVKEHLEHGKEHGHAEARAGHPGEFE